MKIFKGDDTGGRLGKALTITVHTKYDLTDCFVFFNYQGITRKWEGVKDGDTLDLFFSHNETAKMSVGTFKGVMFAVDPAGKYCTIDNAIPITVTTNLRDCYGDNRFEVTVGNAVGWENIIHKPFEGLVVDLSTDDKQLAALGTIIEKLGGTVKASIALLALCAATAFGYTPEANTNSFERDGVTYAQRGGLGMKDFVVTNIDASAVGKVKSVNGRVGDVVLDAAAVNALPDDKDELVSNDNFKEAVVTNALTVSTTNRVAALETAMDEKANSADIPGMVRETMSAEGISSSGINIGGSISGQTIRDQHGYLREAINGKADKTIPSANGNLAALTADGNLADSGKTVDDFLPSEGDISVDGSITSKSAINFIFFPRIGVNSSGDYAGIYVSSFSEIKIGSVEFPTGEEPDLQDALDLKADRSMISATNPTFSNEVATVARTVTPPPSPTLRLFDEVRQCYWIGRMVNGVINWEVE